MHYIRGLARQRGEWFLPQRVLELNFYNKFSSRYTLHIISLSIGINQVFLFPPKFLLLEYFLS